VATAGNWQKQFNRRPKESARALIILAPMSPVRFVYDIEDTEGKPVSPVLLKPFTTTDTLSKDVFEKTIHNGTFHGIMVREILINRQTDKSAIPLTDDIRRQYQDLDLDSRMNYLILINREHRPEDKYAALVQELARIFCGHRGGNSNAWWQDRQQLKTRVKQIETESVAYLVCRRKGLVSNAAKYLKEYQTPDGELPVQRFNVVLQAASYIEDMGKSKWKKPKKTG